MDPRARLNRAGHGPDGQGEGRMLELRGHVRLGPVAAIGEQPAAERSEIAATLGGGAVRLDRCQPGQRELRVRFQPC